jgi:hypothetical protein
MSPLLHPSLVLDTLSFQATEKITITEPSSGKTTGPLTELPDQTTRTAQSLSQTTGKVPNNAPNPGNAEVPDSAKEEDGAQAMMAVKELPFQTKLQVSLWITDESNSD